jgi:hypothetical protein
MHSFQIGQFEILKHDINEFFHGHIGLVIVHSWSVAGLPVPAGFLTFADHLTGLGLVAGPLAYARDVLTVDEAVFSDSTDGNLDKTIAVLSDDRFFGDDVCYIFANGFANLVAMS